MPLPSLRVLLCTVARPAFVAALIGALALPSAFAQNGITDTVGERGQGRGGEGAAHLVLSYRSTPENRVAFREYMETKGVAQFEAWKKAGVMKDYLILFSTMHNAQLFDMWVFLYFDKFADIGNWYGVEQKNPGGLSAEALKLCTPVRCVYTDIQLAGGKHNSDLTQSIFMIIPYKTLVSVTKYDDYSKKYVAPQLEGWVKSGLMPSYEVHQDINPTNAPWDILMVFEYQGLKGVALRDTVKNAVRDQIKDQPGYKEYSPIKLTIRQEDQPTTFVPILPKK
jgi:hypothetical protein